MAHRTGLRKPLASPRHRRSEKIVRLSLWLFEHWALVFSLLYGIFVGVPFLAPVFMRLGWTGPAQLVYSIYSGLCHQMAQRSFFLFGPQPMYNIAQLPIAVTGDGVVDMLALRDFLGSAELGWKVAWSDRMVYMFGGVWLAGVMFGVLQRQGRRIRPLRLPAFALLMLPMIIDGSTHLVSDFSDGLLGGFRYNNQWLADLTGNALPAWFYSGDAFGSFNSWVRLISGVLFAVGVVWFAFPYLERGIRESATILRMKLAKPHV